MKKVAIILRTEHGFSLIELLISLVVLLVVITATSSLLNAGYSGVFSVGRKSNTLYTAQKDIENAMFVGTTLNDNPLSITFPGLSPITLQGKIDLKQYTVDNQTVSVTVFLPKK